MEGDQRPVPQCLQRFSKLRLWIIEYVWAHKMMDILEVMDSSVWPEMDPQPLNLQDCWRLRVVSARVYSIVKSRDIEHFEKGMSFLEETYRLLPRLVTPIKHMKIMFGLKTMTIMWMLRKGRGMVETMFKINQFFPRKLPQYQNRCSQHDMFLMRKNHLDFKAVAQSLVMDKDKLEDYIMNQMQKQYGEHYAQKVEDRLLQYLHKLETVLPGDTYIDKILMKDGPASEEEKLLLEVVASDAATIATALKKILHCDVASCGLGKAPPSLECGIGSSQPLQSLLFVSSSESAHKALEFKTHLEPEVLKEDQADQHVSQDSSLLLENENDSDVRGLQPAEDEGQVAPRAKEENRHRAKEGISQESSERVKEAATSPQFCSKHRRWVKSILQECPDELLIQANASVSPLLFQSSSSATSSQDLTPSDLIPCPADPQHPPSQTSSHIKTSDQTCQQANPEDRLSTESPMCDISEREKGMLSCSSREQPASLPPVQPASLPPVVQLGDIGSVGGNHISFNAHQVFSNNLTTSTNSQEASTSSNHALSSLHTSGNNSLHQGKISNSLNTTHGVQTAVEPEDASIFISCQSPIKRSFSKLSRRFRLACTSSRQSEVPDRSGEKTAPEQLKMAPATFPISCPSLPEDFSASGPPTKDSSTPPCHLGTASTVCTIKHITPSSEIPPRVIPRSSTQHSPCRSVTPSQTSSTSNCMADKSKTSRFQRAQLRLSLPSQAVLLQSNLLQPYVSLTRLSFQHCYHVTNRRSSPTYVEPVAQSSSDDEDADRRIEEEEDDDSSFDLNTLYSSYSSSSGGEDSTVYDPDYKPCIKKKRLLLEYESAWNLIQL